MFKLRANHEKFLRNPLTWIITLFILFAAYFIHLFPVPYSSITVLGLFECVGFIFLVIIFFPLGMDYWFKLTPPTSLLTFLFSGAYYVFVGFMLYKIKVSKHWVKFVIILLLLLIATFIGCTQGVGPKILT